MASNDSRSGFVLGFLVGAAAAAAAALVLIERRRRARLQPGRAGARMQLASLESGSNRARARREERARRRLLARIERMRSAGL